MTWKYAPVFVGRMISLAFTATLPNLVRPNEEEEQGTACVDQAASGYSLVASPVENIPPSPTPTLKPLLPLRLQKRSMECRSDVLSDEKPKLCITITAFY